MLKILNNQIPILDTYQVENPELRYPSVKHPPTGLCALRDEGILETKVWYCMFTTPSSFKVYNIKDLMEPGVYEKIVTKQASIVLDLSFEPFLECIDSIYEDIVAKCHIPPSQVIFLTNMYDADKYNNRSALMHGYPPIRIFWFSALEYMAQEYKDAVPDTLKIKKYDKKFLNLNRRWRPHRPMLTLLLYYYGLLDNGFVSFAPIGEMFNSWEEIWDSLRVGAIGNQEMYDAIEQSESIKLLPPMYLDTNELHINRAELTSSTNSYYEDSYFSVVSETTFYNRETTQNSRFITEKTFKAIAMTHPFILVTIPGSLNVLKALGYQTFSPWINEDYDVEGDDNKRMIMIVKEINRLCNLTPIELESFLVATKRICEYNRNVLLTKKRFIYEK